MFHSFIRRGPNQTATAESLLDQLQKMPYEQLVRRIRETHGLVTSEAASQEGGGPPLGLTEAAANGQGGGQENGLQQPLLGITTEGGAEGGVRGGQTQPVRRGSPTRESAAAATVEMQRIGDEGPSAAGAAAAAGAGVGAGAAEAPADTSWIQTECSICLQEVIDEAVERDGGREGAMKEGNGLLVWSGLCRGVVWSGIISFNLRMR